MGLGCKQKNLKNLKNSTSYQKKKITLHKGYKYYWHVFCGWNIETRQNFQEDCLVFPPFLLFLIFPKAKPLIKFTLNSAINMLSHFKPRKIPIYNIELITYSIESREIIQVQDAQSKATYLAKAFSRRADQNSFSWMECIKISWSLTTGRRSSTSTSTHLPNAHNRKRNIPQ